MAHPATEAVLALLVQKDVKLPSGKTLVPGAVALKEAVAFLDDAVRKEFAGHEADVDLGDQSVVLFNVVHCRVRLVTLGSSTDFLLTSLRKKYRNGNSTLHFC